VLYTTEKTYIGSYRYSARELSGSVRGRCFRKRSISIEDATTIRSCLSTISQSGSNDDARILTWRFFKSFWVLFSYEFVQYAITILYIIVYNMYNVFILLLFFLICKECVKCRWTFIDRHMTRGGRGSGWMRGFFESESLRRTGSSDKRKKNVSRIKNIKELAFFRNRSVTQYVSFERKKKQNAFADDTNSSLFIRCFLIRFSLRPLSIRLSHRSTYSKI